MTLVFDNIFFFPAQRNLQEYADQKEFYDLVFTTREADKGQLKDLFSN